MEAIGHFRLLLKIVCYLDFVDIFVSPTFKQNLVSTSSLDKSGYFYGFGNGKLSISLGLNVIETGILIDRLYILEIIAFHNEIMHANSNGTKQKLNENSASLWHKRLDGILDSLDLTVYEVCVECVKGKLTNARKLSAIRSTDVLELIHMDICGPFPTVVYEYLYLIREKLQSLDVFRSYKVERKLTEARPYRPNERKLESKTISCYFVGYAECSRGFKFYDPTNHSFFETGHSRFLKDVEFGGKGLRNVSLDEVVTKEGDFISLPNTVIESDQGIIQDTLQDTTQVLDNIEFPSIEQTQQPQEVPLRRSTREKRYAIPDDYIVYLVEQEDHVGKIPDDYFAYLME
ncbi:hypothetical protein V2J09_021033 [Rumex salicifolius]